MFDLFRSRDKLVRYFLGALLLLVAASMLTYLIPSYGSGTSRMRDTTVAEIAGEPLTLREVQLVIQGIQRNRQVPPEMLPHYINQLVEGMITNRAMEYEARRLGFRVSEEETSNFIRAKVPDLFQNGQFVGQDVYAALLAQRNLTIPEFERDMSREALIAKLRNVVLQGIVISPAEIEQEFRRRNERAKIEYVKISPDKYRSEIKPTAEQLRDYFNKSRASYSVPEKRSLGLLIFDEAKIAARVDISEAELRRAYDARKDQYRTPERVKARHILLKTTDKMKDAEVRAKAEALLKQLKGGADFAELAKKNSEDPGSASKGGDLGWIVRGQTVPQFESTAFSLKPGQLSDLVKTEYGYHIIQVLEKQEAHLRSFDEVKSELAAELKKQRAIDQMQSMADNAVSALKKNPQHPEQVGAELHMPFVKAEKVGAGDPIPEVGSNRDFETAIGGLGKGEVTPPVQIGSDKLVVAIVTDVFAAHPAEFEEVESLVRSRYIQYQAGTLVEQRAKELAEKAKSMNGDLKKAAQSMGLEAKESGEFTRLGAVEGMGSAGFVADAFTKPAGTIIGPISISDSKFVYKVLGQVPADLANLPAQSAGIRDEIRQRKERQRTELFEDGLLQQLIKEGKVRIHQEVIKNLMASYRG